MTRNEALSKPPQQQCGNAFGYYVEFKPNKFKNLINKIYDEFEKRIEELQAPKTCATCKHMHYWVETDIVECTKNEPPLNWETMKKLSMFEVTYDFGCINYEPKEIK